jgi:hypothetical protein
MYKILISNKAEKYINKMPDSAFIKLDNIITYLSENPFRMDA